MDSAGFLSNGWFIHIVIGSVLFFGFACACLFVATLTGNCLNKLEEVDTDTWTTGPVMGTVYAFLSVLTALGAISSALYAIGVVK